MRFLALTGALVFALGCSSSSHDPATEISGSLDGAPNGNPAEPEASATSPDSNDGGNGNVDVAPDASSMSEVAFHYRPQWQGVTSVAVIGGFGMSTDWSEATPFLALEADASGTFSGKAHLPPGQYLYVFHVVGDSAAMPDTLSRYAIDPTNSEVAACPENSPTFDKNAPNPCSQMAVPQAAVAPPTFHVTGKVTFDGVAVDKYLVVLERDDKAAHHFFANRSTSGSDGTFDLEAAAGQYRFQVLHPTFYSQKDGLRDPVAMQAVRRDLSSSFALSASAAVPPAEVAYHDYAQMAPKVDGGALPTTFTFNLLPGAVRATLTIYGGKSDEIGDPWFSSAKLTTFDGTFTTTKATVPQVVPSDRYFWGTEQALSAASDAGLPGSVQWTAQSMVFPITWH